MSNTPNVSRANLLARKVSPGDPTEAALINGIIDAVTDQLQPRVGGAAYSDQRGDISAASVRTKSEERLYPCTCNVDVPPYSIVEVLGFTTDSGGTAPIATVRPVSYGTGLVHPASGPAYSYGANEEYPILAEGGGWIKLVTFSVPVKARFEGSGAGPGGPGLVVLNSGAVTRTPEGEDEVGTFVAWEAQRRSILISLGSAGDGGEDINLVQVVYRPWVPDRTQTLRFRLTTTLWEGSTHGANGLRTEYPRGFSSNEPPVGTDRDSWSYWCQNLRTGESTYSPCSGETGIPNIYPGEDWRGVAFGGWWEFAPIFDPETEEIVTYQRFGGATIEAVYIPGWWQPAEGGPRYGQYRAIGTGVDTCRVHLVRGLMFDDEEFLPADIPDPSPRLFYRKPGMDDPIGIANYYQASPASAECLIRHLLVTLKVDNLEGGIFVWETDRAIANAVFRPVPTTMNDWAAGPCDIPLEEGDERERPTFVIADGGLQKIYGVYEGSYIRISVPSSGDCIFPEEEATWPENVEPVNGDKILLTWVGDSNAEIPWAATFVDKDPSGTKWGCGLVKDELEVGIDPALFNIDGFNWDEEYCTLELAPGCGITIDGDGIRLSDIAGDDLEWDEGYCKLSLDPSIIERIETLEDQVEQIIEALGDITNRLTEVEEHIDDLIECCEEARECCAAHNDRLYAAEDCCYNNSEAIKGILEDCCDDKPGCGRCVWEFLGYDEFMTPQWDLVEDCPTDGCRCDPPDVVPPGILIGEIVFSDCYCDCGVFPDSLKITVMEGLAEGHSITIDRFNPDMWSGADGPHDAFGLCESTFLSITYNIDFGGSGCTIDIGILCTDYMEQNGSVTRIAFSSCDNGFVGVSVEGQ